MANKSRTASKKAACKRYKDQGKYQKNKVRAVKRHLKDNPNDKQAEACLKVVGTEWKRKGRALHRYSVKRAEWKHIVEANGHVKLDYTKPNPGFAAICKVLKKHEHKYLLPRSIKEQLCQT